MGYVKVTSEELQGVAGQLNSTAAAIDSENAGAMSRVNGLVGAGWEGAASGQFEALCLQWKTGADQVHNALSQISVMLGGAAVAYTETEDSIRNSFAV